ncbi:unannotated protein [freshwater metagenome]|uniref:Unannotated protein n=1 Tax=freshwater metagenome TaxID=449393 RepID=A0A6J7BQW5_9ZZZZ
MPLATPLVMRSFVHCSSATGDTTEVTTPLAANKVDSMSFICCTLFVVNKSTSVEPAGTVNSEITVSPPNNV